MSPLPGPLSRSGGGVGIRRYAVRPESLPVGWLGVGRERGVMRRADRLPHREKLFMYGGQLRAQSGLQEGLLFQVVALGRPRG